MPLDAQSFPHILGQIFSNAPYASLVSLRTASRSLKSRADAVLSTSITIVASADTSPALLIRTADGHRLPFLLTWETNASPNPLSSLSPSIADIHLSHPITPGIEAAFSNLPIAPSIVRYRGSVANYRPITAPLSIASTTLSNPNYDSDSERDAGTSCESLLTYTCDVGAPSSNDEYIIGVRFDPGQVHLPEAWIGGLGQARVQRVTVVFVPEVQGAGCECVRRGEAFGALASLRMVPFTPRGPVESLTLVNVASLAGEGGVVGELGEVVRNLFRTQMRTRRDARVPPFRGWSDGDIEGAVGCISLRGVEEWREMVGEEVFRLATEGER